MHELRFLIYGGRTLLNPTQINILELFSMSNILSQRGFNYIAESKLSDTLLDGNLDKRFDRENKNTFKENSTVFLNKLSEKNFRLKIRDMIYNSSNEEVDGYKFNSNESIKIKYSKTIELLFSYLSMVELKALSSSFGVKIENTPNGGDYDCLINMNNSIINFEVKSGNISNIDDKDLQCFLDRHNFLSPELSILFLDFQKISYEIISKFLGLKLDNYNFIKKIIKIKSEDISLFIIYPNIFVIDLSNNGNILSNVKSAIKFYYKINNAYKKKTFDLLSPKELGIFGEVWKISKSLLKNK